MHTMKSTEQNSKWTAKSEEEKIMNEKIYKTLAHAGIWNLVMGIVVLVTGIASGVLLLVSSVRLLKSKDDLTF